MQRVYPGPLTEFAPEAIYDDLHDDLPDPPEGRPYVLLNMVTSVDGKAALNGSAAGIGSPIDQTLMRAIRAAADGVMVGAGTLRADPTNSSVGQEREAARVARGLPPKPLAIVLSTDGNLPYDRSDFARPQPHRVSLVGAKPRPSGARSWPPGAGSSSRRPRSRKPSGPCEPCARSAACGICWSRADRRLTASFLRPTPSTRSAGR